MKNKEKELKVEEILDNSKVYDYQKGKHEYGYTHNEAKSACLKCIQEGKAQRDKEIERILNKEIDVTSKLIQIKNLIEEIE